MSANTPVSGHTRVSFYCVSLTQISLTQMSHTQICHTQISHANHVFLLSSLIHRVCGVIMGKDPLRIVDAWIAWIGRKEETRISWKTILAKLLKDESRTPRRKKDTRHRKEVSLEHWCTAIGLGYKTAHLSRDTVVHVCITKRIHCTQRRACCREQHCGASLTAI